MNQFLVAFVALSACVCVISADEAKYTDKFDQINVDDILASERLIGNYIKCLINKGPCTPDGAELKKNLPDALQTGCGRCNDRQKITAKKVMEFLIVKRPSLYTEVEAIYDPSGTYKAKYLEEQAPK